MSGNILDKQLTWSGDSDGNPKFPYSQLGGGKPGFQPKGGLLGGGAGVAGGTGMTGSSIRGRSRSILRGAFGNQSLINYNLSRSFTFAPLTGYKGMYGSLLKNKKTSITPFRAAMNAGDVNVTMNKNPYNRLLYKDSDGDVVHSVAVPSNQVNNVRRASLGGYKRLGGAVKTVNYSKKFFDDKQGAADGGEWSDTTGSLWSGNQKYVYDSSDYIRFKKLQAKGRNYNDKSFGGPAKGQSSSELVALGRVRH